MQVTFQFKQNKISNDDALKITRDMFNWLGMKYNTKGIYAYVNSDFERKIFNNMGFERVDEGVLLVLPI